ncbi:MAG: bifunctional demethylmenaquinone methyltransferase/2-methoxy-6-polyprenyl-1,4-benzoquinol methylase UbiE [Flavobacteriales bacterium]|jgi:demethylmenaquinone methyltransferase/2-methoxy-6-polyprenyl-1,4-benzoquinol methylase|tara:strand:- start:9252 stop:9974 length:723 start_codon:yes stop_codon:yes gene_type:complete
MTKEITPYSSKDNKKIQVTQMFDKIANRYDLLNHSLSLGMDFIWRKIAVKKLTNNPKKIIDIATGTADFAISATKYTQANVIGIDISKEMLIVGDIKIKKKNLVDRITLLKGDCENLPFENDSFDAMTAGFGVRNFENLEKGLKEMYRVLQKNSTVVILEPSIPSNLILKILFKFYFSYILPALGKIFSNDSNAYKYLPESVDAFPSGKDFIKELENSGFRKCKHIPLSFGIVALYTAIK